MTNIAYMKQILKHIEDNPQTWTQETWRCDSGMCFAGWAVDLSDRFEWTHTLDEVGRSSDWLSKTTVEDKTTGRRTHVAEAAEILLDIHGDDDPVFDDDATSSPRRRDLFDALNGIDDIRRLISMYEDAEKQAAGADD